MKQRSLYISLLLLVVLFSCKTKKLTQKDPVKEPERKEANSQNIQKVVLQSILQNKKDIPAFSYSAEADYFDGKQSVSLNMDISFKKGQYIYLSAKALGFVNVARVMIQPDSIRILDLINRRYISASYNFMRNFTNVKLGFNELQNMIMVNAFFDPNLDKSKLDTLGLTWQTLLDLGTGIQKASYQSNFEMQSVSLIEQGKNQQMHVDYANFKLVDGINYPHQVVINISGEKKMECKFSINNFAGSIKKEPQFVIPKSYKVQVY
ncbi:MAG: DUF4292 domain-containing protein [Bacteroidia bacterium]|nr:DUF4292 domain-containing protein [Bacteroidia bacterium]